MRLLDCPEETTLPEDIGPLTEELLAAPGAHPPTKITRDRRGKLIQRLTLFIIKSTIFVSEVSLNQFILFNHLAFYQTLFLRGNQT